MFGQVKNIVHQWAPSTQRYQTVSDSAFYSLLTYLQLNSGYPIQHAEHINIKTKFPCPLITTGIPCRTSPQLTFSQWNTPRFLLSKLHRMYISLNTFFSQCLYRKNLHEYVYQKLSKTYSIKRCACKLYILLHTKELFVNNHIVR